MRENRVIESAFPPRESAQRITCRPLTDGRAGTREPNLPHAARHAGTQPAPCLKDAYVRPW
jgi:hypothetical protein